MGHSPFPIRPLQGAVVRELFVRGKSVEEIHNLTGMHREDIRDLTRGLANNPHLNKQETMVVAFATDIGFHLFNDRRLYEKLIPPLYEVVKQHADEYLNGQRTSAIFGSSGTGSAWPDQEGQA
jgi:hypothetical protein